MFKSILKKIWLFILLIFIIVLIMGSCFYHEKRDFLFLYRLNFYTSVLAMISPIISFILVKISAVKSVFNEYLRDNINDVKHNFSEIKSEITKIKKTMFSSGDKKIPETDYKIFDDSINTLLANIENKTLRILEINIINDKNKIDFIDKEIYKLLNKISNHRDNEELIDNLYKIISSCECDILKKLNEKMINYI
ncbi:MAG: hypothetical protein J6K65_06750 [Alphaproteobacteria bacterium]|nr:hypothetical protein [Alphaproteobacteria bacterium]